MSSELPIFKEDEIRILKNQIAVGCSDEELKFFMYICKKTGLDPFTRQIYLSKRKSKDDKLGWIEKMTIQTSIDGLRLISERSDKYEGQTGPFWCGIDGQWKDVWISDEPPYAAKVGVYKKGFREALNAVAHFNEYAQKKSDGSLNKFWSDKPSVMIAKCAEALALRKAFPNELSGLYTNDEIKTEVSTDNFENPIDKKLLTQDKNEPLWKMTTNEIYSLLDITHRLGKPEDWIYKKVQDQFKKSELDQLSREEYQRTLEYLRACEKNQSKLKEQTSKIMETAEIST